MSKILSSVLDRIRENNNEYRSKLRDLNIKIEEKTTTLMGDLVTSSNYTLDFSDAISSSKDELINPILRVIESYVIKDLRSVEMVNEQFLEKINDKLENENINTKEDKDKFIKNLNILLNEKYLEIVKIKRVNFLDENGVNADVEKIVSDYLVNLKSKATFNEDNLENKFSTYKDDLYALVSSTLLSISDLYLNNFVDEIKDALNAAIDFSTDVLESDAEKENNLEKAQDFRPFIPDMNPVPEVELPLSMPSDLAQMKDKQLDLPNTDEDINTADKVDELGNLSDLINNDMPLVDEIKTGPIKPIEVSPEVKEIKKPLDVEEILKIAKSPVASVEDENYVNVSKIDVIEEKEDLMDEFNEREIVEEMIRRLTKRLEEIDLRQSKYDEEKRKIKEDEAFVNDLIESSSNKKIELDKFEKELDAKKQDLEEKEKELSKKINDVLPFANAVLKDESDN